jgi:DNA-binding CsgD family transcriptional regulator
MTLAAQERAAFFWNGGHTSFEISKKLHIPEHKIAAKIENIRFLARKMRGVV